VPTPTPLPPIEITLPPNYFCVDLAAVYNVSLQSILALNPGLNCNLLVVGQTILIPQPTPTPAPPPTETLSPEDATAAACETVSYEVQEGEALSAIADNYNVSMEAIMNYNSMTGTTVYTGQRLIIPLCYRNPTPGPSPTPTSPPPYPAPNLLLPLDGAAFTLADDTVTLQWAAVAQLREGELYQVIIEDVTEGSGTVRLVQYVSDTKYIVPVSFRPAGTLPHILRWWVTAVRQTGTNEAGNPIYAPAGASSIRRVFTWSAGAVGATPTP
jgi:LysM repeat protein